MRVLLLTTDTPHHAFFLRELVQLGGEARVIEETTALAPPFESNHPFESERDAYEVDLWFSGRKPKLADLASVTSVSDVNSELALQTAAAYRPDLTVVFGTRRLKHRMILAGGSVLVNLHGGDPEYYRGLDSHLWTIYHGDFANLVTTLHVVNETLDDGAIVGIRAIPLERGMKLHQLRRSNTECALELLRAALGDLSRHGTLSSRKQRQSGRYYSFMPTALKDLCVKRFEAYCASLP